MKTFHSCMLPLANWYRQVLCHGAHITSVCDYLMEIHVVVEPCS